MVKIRRIFLSVLGLGYLPLAPGTYGSAATAALFLLAAWLTAAPVPVVAIMLVVAVLGAVLTVSLGDRAIAELGPDPGMIVTDELSGQAVTYLGLWSITSHRELIALTLVGFVLFRVFDIVKPPPARQLERVPGAWGVLLDDIMAGIYANICLHLIWHTGWLSRV